MSIPVGFYTGQQDKMVMDFQSSFGTIRALIAYANGKDLVLPEGVFVRGKQAKFLRSPEGRAVVILWNEEFGDEFNHLAWVNVLPNHIDLQSVLWVRSRLRNLRDRLPYRSRLQELLELFNLA